ncbi:MAG: cytochrome c oxidase subunit 3 [Verrucomicrobiota bacterium]|jgi:cytochrome c oxidase subunit 3|nr:cytochrome c oxidase subunit 3 [Verrucomicrobiota bacterium]
MELPYNSKPRPDTGLYNGKVGIWLFLASEIMLFGGLFSAYLLLRVGADDGNWSMGLMTKWVGAFNTFILIASSATVVLAWVCLKLKDWAGFRFWKWWTVGFAATFLIVKWGYEWPAKFTHYDITFTSNQQAEKVFADVFDKGSYNDCEEDHRKIWNERYDADGENKDIPEGKKAWGKVDIKDKPLDGHVVGYYTENEQGERQHHKVEAAFGISFWSHAFAWRYDARNTVLGITDTFSEKGIVAVEIAPTHGVWDAHPEEEASAANRRYAEADNDTGHDGHAGHGHHKAITIETSQISRLSSYEPAHSTFFAVYYTLTGLHALHVFGGILVMLYHLLPISQRVYESDPERFTNRIEITGLFWHFVDLVWIFLFPILYLL